jgi:hypothetical protein
MPLFPVEGGTFCAPIHGSPNTALNIQCNTTGANVYWSLSGFLASAN